MKLIRRIALFLSLACLANAAVAQGTNVAFGGLKADPTLPVEVTANQLDVDQNDGTALLQGEVLIVQGEMRLSADRVFVVYRTDQSGIDRMEAIGNVVLVSGPDAAEAERVDYSIDTGIVIMTGNVLLTQGPAAIAGDRMTVNLTDGTAQMTGRVKTVLQPAGDQ